MVLRRRAARRVLAVAVSLVVLPLGACGDDAATRADDTVAPASTGAPSSASTGASAGDDDASADDGVEQLTLRVERTVPHDADAFTQGLDFSDDGRLFESLGIEGRSTVREVDLDTGAVVRESELAPDEFGEGLVVVDDELTQLTWKSGVAHRWSLDTLEPLGEATYTGEGWGLTFDGEHFVQSDGSGRLTFRDPDEFDPVRTIDVTRAGRAVDELNELEYVDGVIWANVWHSDEILRIDPTSGEVTGVLDASGLWTAPERNSEMTLNGIAHRPGDPPDRLWLTGKNWPEMYEVTVR